MAVDRVILRGSERRAIPNAQAVGTPDPNSITTVTLILRRRHTDLPEPGSETLSREEFAHRFGANPADVLLVEEFASDNDLTVDEIDLARRTMVLTGTIANLNEAFGIQMQIYQSPAGLFRGRAGNLFIPNNLENIIVAVLGLDERPQARTHLRRYTPQAGLAAAGDTSYTPIAVSKLYDYPAATGSGQTVAIIELGGGFRSAELKSYFSGLGLKSTPMVTAVSVDGAQNTPIGDPNSDDAEVLLDIEIVGAIAPAAKIAVYFGPNTDQGFLDAITTAIHDPVRKPSVVSISWGGPESSWTAQALSVYDQAFQDASLLGVTVCCASGDDGSSDGETDGAAHVDFPASSPHVLACGGTRLESSKSKITKEVVWNNGAGNGASGGGISETFPLPSYQANANVPLSANPSKFKGRGVPDISGDADPGTGYQILVDGRSAIFGGTSAVAPLWAALVALINQHRGKPLGFLHTALYAAAGSKALTDITSGDNGAYKAGAGWDPCTGLGRPDGQALLTAVSGKQRAGTART